MKRLETGCPRCRLRQSIPTQAVFLTRSASSGNGWLVCRGCGDLVAIRLPDAAIATLAAAGCHVLDEPQATPHPERWTDGPPLGADDVLALHELLGDERALAAALSRIADRGERSA